MKKQSTTSKTADKQHRQFKGVWITAKIYTDNSLSWSEKIALVEIDSWTSQGKSCFFSNAYLGKFLQISERQASRIINSLIEKGLVIKTSTDGRQRHLESTLDNLSGEGRHKGPPRVDEKGDHNNTVNKPDEVNTGKPVTIGHQCRLEFEKFLKEQHKPDYYWTPKDATNMKQIAAKIATLHKAKYEKEAEDGEIVTTWGYILRNLPAWYKENGLDPATINSKFNNIIQKLKNGTANDIDNRISSHLQQHQDNSHRIPGG